MYCSPIYGFARIPAARPKLCRVPTFVLFGGQHLTALGLVIVASLAAFRVGAGRHSDRVNLLAGLFLLVYGVGLWTYKLRDGFDRLDDLPLQLCDITYLLCMACFVNPRRVPLTLVTYWGLAGTLQALVTPDLRKAFPSLEFCFFFIGHSVIVLAVFFLLGRAPQRDLAGVKGVSTAFAGLLAYTLVVGGLDYLFSLNYGYLAQKPDAASVLDYLGPWPVYIASTLAYALVLFIILALLLRPILRWGSAEPERTP